jgi:hypothetical protein
MGSADVPARGPSRALSANRLMFAFDERLLRLSLVYVAPAVQVAGGVHLPTESALIRILERGAAHRAILAPNRG